MGKYFSLPEIKHDYKPDKIYIEYNHTKHKDIQKNQYNSIFPSYIDIYKYIGFDTTFNVGTGKLIAQYIVIKRVKELENKTGKTREEIADTIIENLLSDGNYPITRTYKKELSYFAIALSLFGFIAYFSL